MELRRETLDTPSARRLIGALNAELTATYPEEGATHFDLDPQEVAAGRGAFLVGYEGEEAVACGAVRRLNERDAELKRMYVVDAARGQGLGRALLAALEDEARGLGAERVVLETGVRQRRAIGMYEAAGYQRIECLGQYAESPLSVCYAKPLAAGHA